MTTQTAFRCYYDDGTITVADVCSATNSNGSPLIKSELSIIEDVSSTFEFPWWLAILGLIMIFSKERK